jgi:hypothetical protein
MEPTDYNVITKRSTITWNGENKNGIRNLTRE